MEWLADRNERKAVENLNRPRLQTPSPHIWRPECPYRHTKRGRVEFTDHNEHPFGMSRKFWLTKSNFHF